MIRIALMVVRSLFRIPSYMYHLIQYGKPDDSHTEYERYIYLRKLVKRVNHVGRVKVVGYGEENIPEKDGFIMFPNHQGLFDSLAIIETCSHPFGICRC